jgi:hypothetical protein
MDVQHWLYADPVIPALAAEVSVRLFANPSRPLAAWDRPGFYLRLRERWRDRLPYAGYLVYRTLTSHLIYGLTTDRNKIPSSDTILNVSTSYRIWHAMSQSPWGQPIYCSPTCSPAPDNRPVANALHNLGGQT